MRLCRSVPAFLAALALTVGAIPAAHAQMVAASVQVIRLESTQADGTYTHSATVDGEPVPEYDYTWHADPAGNYIEVKDLPGEYYTGTRPSGDDGVYIAHDIYYYPELPESGFQKVSYDGDQEWVYFYENPEYEDYIFSTLPVQRTGFPSQMMHSPEEAYQNAVLHITQPGTYRLEGSWHGQIWVDLGEDAVFSDPAQKVTLILNGVDITCTVAPGVVFASVYECDNGWEDAQPTHLVDTVDAGAVVVIADGTENTVSGTNVYRMLKAKYKDKDDTDAHPAQKKGRKLDGAFYSYQSLRILGEKAGAGVLTIEGGFEGLGSELHLTLEGGNVQIFSQDDGINVNEDGVSVLTVNGGSLHICAGLGAEGDGIDSNGYLVVDGGTVISLANPASDSGMDSDRGSFVNGGTVVALGSTMDWAEADDSVGSNQAVMNLQFSGAQDFTEAIVVTDAEGKVLFAYDPDKDEVAGKNSRSYQGAVISGPGLAVGSTCYVYIGGDVEGTEASGIYDPSTVSDFRGAVLQCHSGSGLGDMGRPGGMGGQFGSRPSGEAPADGMGPPDGWGPPEALDRPANGQGRGQGFDQKNGGSCTSTSLFSLDTRVNAFGNVGDFSHTLTLREDGVYACSVCGQRFADAQGLRPMEQSDAQVQPASNTPEQENRELVVALWFVGGTFLVFAGALVFFALRKKE